MRFSVSEKKVMKYQNRIVGCMTTTTLRVVIMSPTSTTMTNLTTTQSTAQALHDAGVEMETYFYWWHCQITAVDPEPVIGVGLGDWEQPFSDGFDVDNERLFPAPTLNELLEVLPPGVQVRKHKIGDKYEVYYDHHQKKHYSANHENPAEAAAKILLHIEEGHVDDDKLNKQ